MQTPPYTPENRLDELLQNHPNSRSKRSRASSIVSTASSEDGAVFLGKAPPRPLTPQPQKRRPEPIKDTTEPIVTPEEDTSPRSPIQWAYIWLEDQWTRTQRDETEFLRQLVLFLFIALAFVAVRGYNAECPPQSPGAVVRGHGGDSAWLAVHHDPWPMMDKDAELSPKTLAGDTGSPPWKPAQSKPKIPLNTDIASSNSGTSAFAIWSFIPTALPDFLQPFKLKEGVKSLLHPATIAGAVRSFAQRQAIGWVWSGATSTIMPVREPDIHGWDVIIANQERRQYFLSVLGEMEKVSSQLHVELSSQLFENAEHLSAIQSYQELQTHLTELKTHQYEIVRLLAIYHKVSLLASTTLDDYVLAGHSPTNLNSLRSSILNTGPQLLMHLNAAQENIGFVTRAVASLPWKTNKQKWWLGRWIDMYRYRGIVQAADGLEYLRVHVDTVCGMVTSDLQALR